MLFEIRNDNYKEYITSYSLEEKTAPGKGKEAETINLQIEEASFHYTLPYSTQTDIHKFCILADTWKEETKYFSSTNQIAMNQSYQQIIGMGEKVVPFILEHLRLESDQWFWALKAITGVDPVRPENIGNINKMTESWLDWGRRNGYIV